MLTQKQEKHIERARIFQSVFLVSGILLLIIGFYYNLTMYRLSLNLDTKPLYNHAPFVFGVWSLVTWDNNRIWLKIVKDLRKENKDF